MISGIVTASRHATVQLTVQGAEGVTREIEAVIDTGFNWELTLPLRVVTALGLTWRRSGRALLAEGGETLFDSYDATVIWDGKPRLTTADAAETEPLVGMALLDGYELTVQAVVGGSVAIRAMP